MKRAALLTRVFNRKPFALPGGVQQHHYLGADRNVAATGDGNLAVRVLASPHLESVPKFSLHRTFNKTLSVPVLHRKPFALQAVRVLASLVGKPHLASVPKFSPHRTFNKTQTLSVPVLHTSGDGFATMAVSVRKIGPKTLLLPVFLIVLFCIAYSSKKKKNEQDKQELLV